MPDVLMPCCLFSFQSHFRLFFALSLMQQMSPPSDYLIFLLHAYGFALFSAFRFRHAMFLPFFFAAGLIVFLRSLPHISICAVYHKIFSAGGLPLPLMPHFSPRSFYACTPSFRLSFFASR